MRQRMPSNALIVLPTDVIGGAEKVAMTLAEHLYFTKVFSRIDIYFMCRGRTGKWARLENLDGINIYYTNKKSEKTSIPSLVRFLFKRRKEYDFIYSTHMHVNAFLSFLFYLKIVNAPFKVARESTVISDRFFGLKGFVMSVLYKFYGSHDLLICQTKYMRERLIETRGSKIAKSITVIPNPVNYNRLREYGEQNDVPNDANKKFVILMVGRLVGVKNHILALKALVNLNDKGLLPNHLQFLIVGDGPLRKELELFALQNGIKKYMTFIGHKEVPYELMTSSDIGLLTSIKEGFPNVLLEMMTCGTKHIMTTPCAGDLENIEHLTVFDNFEVETLAAELINAINCPLDFSNQYIRQAKKRDVSEYWKTINEFNSILT
jgi:glycosyltransferase involved in cell wall biosynthesis